MNGVAMRNSEEEQSDQVTTMGDGAAATSTDSSKEGLIESGSLSERIEKMNQTREDEAGQDDTEQAERDKATGGNPRKVFVGNIPFEVRSRELKSFFSSFGNVKHVQLLWDRGRRRFKGSAFVVFCTIEGALAARTASDGSRTLDGRVLTVTAAEGRSRRSKVNKSLGDSAGDDHSTGSASVGSQERVDAADLELGPLTISDSDRVYDQSMAGTLPDNVLIKIFSHLRLDDRIRIERVCRRWHYVAYHSWQSVQVLDFKNTFKGLSSTGRHVLTHKILKSILKRGCSNLRYLDVSASPRMLNNHSAELIGRICPHLTHLDLSGTRISKHGIRQLSSLCTRLKRIELRRCLNINEEGFWWLLKNSGNVEYFDARENLRITGQCFYMLNPACYTVIVDDCTNLSDMGIKRLTDKCPDLRTLSISRCYQLTGVSMQRIAENCKSLVKLSLNGDFPSILSGSLCHISRLLMLKELYLKDNLNVSDEVLLKIGRGCSSLRLLDITGCHKQVSSVGLASLTECHSLEDINISYIDEIIDAGVEALALHCPLKRLVVKSCPNLTDEALLSLSDHCPTVEEVDLSGCEGITDEGVKEFIRERGKTDIIGSQTVVHLIVGGTSVTDSLPSLVPPPEVCGVEVSLMDLSVPQHRLQLESYGRFFPSDDEEDDWNGDDDSDPLEAAGPLPEHPGPLDPPSRPLDPPSRPTADHSHHLEELGVDDMDEWNNQRQMYYGVAAGSAMPEDYAEDFLDADDPSLWEDEFFS